MTTQFTTPQHAWSVGEVVTAANMNTYLANNMAVVGTPPVLVVKITGAQTFDASQAETQLNWGASGAYIDSVGGWDTGSQIYTVAVPGIYEFNLSVLASVDSGSPGVNQWQVAIQQNGSDSIIGIASTFESTSETCRAFGKVRCAVGDTLGFFVYNGDGLYDITTVVDPGAGFGEVRWFSA